VTTKRWAGPWEKPRKGWQSRERQRHCRVWKNAEVPSWSGPERERGRSKHESGARGDGLAADCAGKALGRLKTKRAMNSELTQPVAQRNGFLAGRMPWSRPIRTLTRRHEPRRYPDPVLSIASMTTSEQGNVRRARVIRKDSWIAGRRKALKGESQERPGQK